MIALPHRPVNGLEDDFSVSNVRDVAEFERGSSRSHRELGVPENWNAGIVEEWNGGKKGIMECWPLFHCSIIPFLRYCLNRVKTCSAFL